jgi:hypothetical protein
LASALVVRELLPWHENLSKRQVRASKVYVRDSGMLHALLAVPDLEALGLHPRVGASWEGFALEQVLALVGPGRGQPYFWATHAGAELDLLVVHGTRRFGYEFKRTSTPRVTRSMHVALDDLRLERLDVVVAGFGHRGETRPTCALCRAKALAGRRTRVAKPRSRHPRRERRALSTTADSRDSPLVYRGFLCWTWFLPRQLVGLVPGVTHQGPSETADEPAARCLGHRAVARRLPPLPRHTVGLPRFLPVANRHAPTTFVTGPGNRTRYPSWHGSCCGSCSGPVGDPRGGPST